MKNVEAMPAGGWCQVAGKKRIALIFGVANMLVSECPSTLPDRQSHLMGLSDLTVLLSARKSQANCLDFYSKVILIIFPVIWELSLFIFLGVLAMKRHI